MLAADVVDDRRREIAEIARLVREHLEWEAGLQGIGVPFWEVAAMEAAAEPIVEAEPVHVDPPRVEPPRAEVVRAEPIATEPIAAEPSEPLAELGVAPGAADVNNNSSDEQ